MEAKKIYGLFILHHFEEDGAYVPTSCNLICVSCNMDRLLDYSQILQKAADLLKDLFPNRGYHTSYNVDEVNSLDL